MSTIPSIARNLLVCVLSLSLGFSDVHAAEREGCDLSRPVRVTVLFDNSASVVNHAGTDTVRVQDWLEAMLMVLRPRDVFELHTLAPSRNVPLPTARRYIVPAGEHLRRTQPIDSAVAYARHLFGRKTAVDTTDLTASIRQVVENAAEDAPQFCANVLIIVTDGSLHPFSLTSGRIPDPSATVDSLSSLVAALRSNKVPVYAVSIGTGAAIDGHYAQSWLQQEGRSVIPELARLPARQLLERLFGAVYELEESSLERMFFRDSTSVWASALGLVHESPTSLDHWVNRRTSYVILEEPASVESSWCQSPTVSGVVATRSPNRRCFIHAERLTDHIRRHHGSGSASLMTQEHYLARELPDSIDDVHFLLISQPVATRPETTCTSSHLFSAFFEGKLLNAKPVALTLRVSHLHRATGRHLTRYSPLVHLVDTNCLALQQLSDHHDAPEPFHLDVEILARDGSADSILFQAKRPLRPSLFQEWKLYRTRTLVSSIFLRDRWYVEGRVVIANTGSMRGDGRVYIDGPTSQPLREMKCSHIEAETYEGVQSCYVLGNIFVGPAPPELALIAFTSSCDMSPRNCHFAGLSPRSRFLLPLPMIILLATVGMFAGFAHRWRRLDQKELRSLVRIDILLSGLGIALTFVWMGEVFTWALPLNSAWQILEILIPLAFAVGISYPATFFEVFRKLARSLTHGDG
jgi:hypothetical protein